MQRRAACRSRGMTATTIRMRRLCAAATRSTRAPKRSPSTDISAAPPGTLAKSAVVRSMPAQARERKPRTRSRGRSRNTAPSASSDHESRDLAHDVRREIEPERRADDPLADLAAARRRAEVARRATRSNGEREQRAQHPRESACAAGVHASPQPATDGQRASARRPRRVTASSACDGATLICRCRTGRRSRPADRRR